MQSRGMKRQKNLLLLTFLAIPCCLLILFVIYPIAQLFNISLTDWNGMTKGYNYIGLWNFQEIITDKPEIWISLKNNMLYFVIHLFFIPVEIVTAYLLSKKTAGNDFFKKVILLPYILNGVAISYIFSTFFAPAIANGTLNTFLVSIGLGRLSNNWLGDPDTVNLCLVSVSVWRFSGFHVVLFIAAIQSIPDELFEAAVIDGAGEIDMLCKIVLPSITVVIEVVLFLNVRGALQVFDIPFVMTNGGPGYASSTFTLFTIQTAFRFNDFGKASAMAVLLFFIIIALSAVQQFIFRKGSR